MVVHTGVHGGSCSANYAELTGIEQQCGRIVAAQVLNRLTGETLRIRTNMVVNAGGDFASRIEALAGEHSNIHITPAKGVHLTVPRDALKIDQDAIVLPET